MRVSLLVLFICYDKVPCIDKFYSCSGCLSLFTINFYSMGKLLPLVIILV